MTVWIFPPFLLLSVVSLVIFAGKGQCLAWLKSFCDIKNIIQYSLSVLFAWIILSFQVEYTIH